MRELQEMNPDQARESVNTAQRFAAWCEARQKRDGYRGSLVWHEVDGETYLTRSYYDAAGRRRQKVEGRRGAETERTKAQWDRGRADADTVLAGTKASLLRQTAVNRALKLGRVPITTARIVRALDDAGLLGHGLRIVGTNAVYCYEAAAGVFVDAAATATQDVDLLMDARMSLKIVAGEAAPGDGLIALLRKVDRSFERTAQTFRAANKDGFLVDLIKPSRNPPWLDERETVGTLYEDLVAVGIDGVAWLENAPSFESVVIDERGAPLRMVAVDPRVFAAHKLWVSALPGREPIKRKRDRLQADVVGAMVGTYFQHLPYDEDALRMLPRKVFRGARPLFVDVGADDTFG